ncbi:hypothetical protein NQD34_008355 [Periophthalmus magnuspinnatus]|nr:hypothetical protein NQD34_008355 [Periophthalmus magnuspinnatus]
MFSPCSGYGYNGLCYKYVAPPLTWGDAELQCVSQEANLVPILSVEENNFVKTLIQNFDQNQGETWIGLDAIYKKGT